MPEAALDLEPQPSSVAAARHFVTDCLLGSHAERLLDPTVLLVSEVVTNALFHGKPPIRMSVHVDGTSRVLVEVADAEPTPPVVRDTDPLDEGRGLKLVDALASDWGYRHPATQGKIVWFEVVR